MARKLIGIWLNDHSREPEMLLHGSGIKRLAVESLLALSLAWASLQLGHVYASEGECAGLTALGAFEEARDPLGLNLCQKDTISGE
ncbi:MAG: hypothetical protein AAF552_01380 [Pseudomonadota bacterium]